MKSVNLTIKALPAIIAAGIMAAAGAASAQTVVGGGATLPQQLYNDLLGLDGSASEAIGTWSYTGTGSGAGKKAFLNNNPQATVGSEFRDENTAGRPIWPTTQGVHFAGSDSALTTGAGSELTTYNATFRPTWGPLIQIPAVATPVLLPYKETNVTKLNLTTDQICKIFSFDSTARNWSQVTTAADDGAVGAASAIQVVYRTEGSGTTELLSRFLNAACSSSLPNGKSFTISNSFKAVIASALPTLSFMDDVNGDGIPDVWVGAKGDEGVSAAVAVNHRLGYLSPDPNYTSSSNSFVARINTFSPTAASIQAALPAPPSGSARSVASSWVPAYTYSASVYPIYGTTNLLVGQCYQGGFAAGTVGGAVKDFVTKLNNGTYDSQIAAHNFIKLPAAWNAAIKAEFLDGDATRKLEFGNVDACNGVGRPL